MLVVMCWLRDEADMWEAYSMYFSWSEKLFFA